MPEAPEPRYPRAPLGGKAKAGIGGAAAIIIAAVLAVEGGYVNHPADPGGETNMGITKRVAVANGYTGPMRTLPREVATSIYYREYLVKPGYAPLIPIDAAVTEELFDTTVNMGPLRPSRWFQQNVVRLCNVNLNSQGIDATIRAYAACQQRVGAARLCKMMLGALDADQATEYARLVRVNPKLRVFYRGWMNKRVGNVDRRKCEAGQ